jgi:hypothetical protein
VKHWSYWFVALILVLLSPGASAASALDDPPAIASFNTARVRIEGTVSAQGQVLPVQGEGEIDATRGASRLTLAVLGAAFETIVVDGRTYSRNLVTGRWEYSEGTQAGGFNPARLAPYDPDTIRAAGRNFTRVGPETVGGVATTHWRADADLNLLLGLSGPAASGSGLGQDATMDLWIGDADQRLRRLTVEAQGAAPASALPGAAASAGPTRQSLTLTFDSFDTNVQIIAPPGAVPATPGAFGGAGAVASPVTGAPVATRAAARSTPSAPPSAAPERTTSLSSILIVRALGVVSLSAVGIAILIALRHRRTQTQYTDPAETDPNREP